MDDADHAKTMIDEHVARLEREIREIDAEREYDEWVDRVARRIWTAIYTVVGGVVACVTAARHGWDLPACVAATVAGMLIGFAIDYIINWLRDGFMGALER